MELDGDDLAQEMKVSVDGIYTSQSLGVALLFYSSIA